MKQDEYLSTLGKRRLFRVLAWICLIIIGVSIIATFITGVTGSKYFLPCLAVTFIIPFFMYVILWIGKVLSSLNSSVNEADDKKE